jgi:hypothetical protein
VGGGLHVPGFGSADASALALKAREIAVLKREEAAAVRFRYQQITFFLFIIPKSHFAFTANIKSQLVVQFSIMVQARVDAINARLRALGREEWNPSCGN